MQPSTCMAGYGSGGSHEAAARQRGAGQRGLCQGCELNASGVLHWAQGGRLCEASATATRSVQRRQRAGVGGVGVT